VIIKTKKPAKHLLWPVSLWLPECPRTVSRVQATNTDIQINAAWEYLIGSHKSIRPETVELVCYWYYIHTKTVCQETIWLWKRLVVEAISLLVEAISS